MSTERGRSRSQHQAIQSPSKSRQNSFPCRSISPRTTSLSRSLTRSPSHLKNHQEKPNGIKSGERSRTPSGSRSSSRARRRHQDRSYTRSRSRDSLVPKSSKVGSNWCSLSRIEAPKLTYLRLLSKSLPKTSTRTILKKCLVSLA